MAMVMIAVMAMVMIAVMAMVNKVLYYGVEYDSVIVIGLGGRIC